MSKIKHDKVPDEDVADASDQLQQKEETGRGNWSGKFDFILSALGYAVGLGNVWRFPYLCFKHGGGSFLIPYLIMLFLVGIPMMFLEFSIGQFSALASLPLFKHLCPLFSGIGYSIVITSILGSSIYMLVLSWSIFYFFDSFRSDLQWQSCQHGFNSPNCFSNLEFEECLEMNGKYLNHTCFNSSHPNFAYLNHTAEKLRVASSAEYFEKFVIGRTSGIEDFGSFNWRIWLCVILSWTIVFFSCIKGVKSSGKVVYFTATFPYIMLFVLLIRGATLEGALGGVMYYITPKWEKLGEITIWLEAAVQISLSLGIGSGGSITLASYNKFNNNVLRDALIVSIGNCLTSIFAGFATFSVIGYIAKSLNKDVEDVVKGGPGLAFVLYPEAVSLMPLSPLWSILFFLMLITLGLDSVFGTVENIVSSVVDDVPRLRSKKVFVLLGLCLMGCIIGIPLSLGSGIYFLDLCFAVIGWKNLLIGILEFIIVGHLYGMAKFMANQKMMRGWSPTPFLAMCLKILFWVVTPAILSILVLFTFINYKPFESAGYSYPPWGDALGWVISFSPCLIIVAFIVAKLVEHRELPIFARLKLLSSPTELWYQHYYDEQNSDHSDNQHEMKDLFLSNGEAV